MSIRQQLGAALVSFGLATGTGGAIAADAQTPPPADKAYTKKLEGCISDAMKSVEPGIKQKPAITKGVNGAYTVKLGDNVTSVEHGGMLIKINDGKKGMSFIQIHETTKLDKAITIPGTPDSTAKARATFNKLQSCML